MDALSIVEMTKIATSYGFLVASSFFDYRDRRVPNLVFILFAVAASTITLIDVYFSSDILAQLGKLLLYVAVSFTLFYVVFYLGLFGGADAKILMALSIIMPWPPKLTARTVFAPSLPIFSISIFNNTLLASILTVPYALISNIRWRRRTGRRFFENLESESPLKKMTALVLCIKTEKSRIKPYDMVAEESGKITLLKKVREEDLTEEELKNLPEDVFVTFSIPMVIFITIGFTISIFLGDLVIFLVMTFLSR